MSTLKAKNDDSFSKLEMNKLLKHLTGEAIVLH